MAQTRETTIYGPQSRDDIPKDPPVPDRPVMVLVASPDGTWWYRWWDRGHDYVTGHAPTRDLQRPYMEAVLPALMADYARCHPEGRIVGQPD